MGTQFPARVAVSFGSLSRKGRRDDIKKRAPGAADVGGQGMNKTQRLQKWFEARGRWDYASYGEFLHVGANQTTMRAALKGLEITEQTTVLDMACAVGGNARWLASLFGCRVWGNDIDDAALAVARDLAVIEEVSHLCTFVNARVEHTGFDPDHFDIVTSTDIFDINEVRRVLRPGGRFIVSMLCTDPKATFASLTREWRLELEVAMDVTQMALAFQRAKEEEAALLAVAGMIQPKDLVEMFNESIAPYTQGGRHLLMRLRKKG